MVVMAEDTRWLIDYNCAMVQTRCRWPILGNEPLWVRITAQSVPNVPPGFSCRLQKQLFQRGLYISAVLARFGENLVLAEGEQVMVSHRNTSTNDDRFDVAGF